MKNSWMFNAVVVLLLIAVTAFVFAESTGSEYMQGKVDGKRDGASGASPLWIGAGCLGCLGVGAAYFIGGEPPADKLVGKSADYVLGYTETYKKAARDRQGMYAWIGFGIQCVVGVIYYVFVYSIAYSYTPYYYY